MYSDNVSQCSVVCQAFRKACVRVFLGGGRLACSGAYVVVECAPNQQLRVQCMANRTTPTREMGTIQ